METKDKNKIITIIVILAIVGLVLIFFNNKDKKNESAILTGKIAHNLTYENTNQNYVEINKNETILCCQFNDSEGNTKTCVMLNKFGCDYCKDFC